MRFHVGRALAVVAAVALLTGSALRVQAGELGLLEMLFGARPAVQPARTSPDRSAPSPRRRVGAARHRLRTQYSALPVRIRVSHLQTPLDMRQGAAAALLKDETLRPGDIVVLGTGPRVFTGSPDRRHTMSEFEPVRRSPYVTDATRKLLAGMMAPVGARPADEARRTVARLRNPASSVPPVTVHATAMRVINPWQTTP